MAEKSTSDPHSATTTANGSNGLAVEDSEHFDQRGKIELLAFFKRPGWF